MLNIVKQLHVAQMRVMTRYYELSIGYIPSHLYILYHYEIIKN